MPQTLEGDLGGNLEEISHRSDPDTETFRWLMEAWAKGPTLRIWAVADFFEIAS